LLLVAIIYLLLYFADLVLLDHEADLIVGVLGQLLEFRGVTSFSKHLAVVLDREIGGECPSMVFVNEFVELKQG